VTLVLEVTSTRLFAYIGSSHATSTALAIALLGLSLGAALRLREPRALRFAARGLPLALAGLAFAASLGLGLVGLVALALVPFACAGMLVSEAYAARGAEHARATYALDLAAAACGCLIAPRLVGPLSPIEIMFALGLVACAIRPHGLVIAVLACGLLGARYLPDGPLHALRADGAAEKAMLESRGEVVDSAWSPVGRLDVRRMPDDGRLGVFTDGMSPTYLVRDDAFEATWGFLMSLPYRALAPKRVLVLGAGAGASVVLAAKYGAAAIDAVEVNPALPGVLARWGDVYAPRGAHLYIDDARHFMRDAGQYDLIELALALTGNVHAQAAGLESHLYTVEAVRLYLAHLTPDGALVLIHSDPGNAYRQLRTVIAALGAQALDHIAVLRDERPGTAYRYLIVARRSAMTTEIADALDVSPAELLWGPGDPPERAAELLDATKIGATEADDLAPVHDDRPYFFQNTRGVVATALAEPGRLWVLAGAIALLLVLVRRRDAATAACLGAAYLCVELALIQRFTLAAGGTLYAVSFVLFALLAWSAVGALLLRARSARWACVAAALAVAVTGALVPDAGGLATLALLLAPVGLALGRPFPALLARGDLARLWTINGAASVAGGVIAVLALRVFGATDALYLGAGIYLAAALLSPA